MPTLNTSTGELEGGSAKKPSGLLNAAMNKAGAILGIIGTALVTDASGQQQLAIATVPQQPGQGGPVTPGNGESTTEVPTAGMIIQILKKEVGTIKRKFPSCTDAALAKMVGEITLGTIDSKRLETLSGAFEKGSPEWEALMNFSKVVSIPKPPTELASPLDNSKKLPPLNEDPKKKKMRLERESLLEKINKSLLKKEHWSVDTSKGGDAKITNKDNGILAEFKTKDKNALNAEGIVNFPLQLPPGKYIIELDSSGVPPVIYLYDMTGGRIDQSGKPAKDCIVLKAGVNQLSIPQNGGKLLLSGLVNNVGNPSIEIRSIKIAPIE